MRFLIVTPLIPPEPGGPSYYSVALKEALERADPVRNETTDVCVDTRDARVSNGAGHTVDLLAFAEVRQYPSGVRHLILLYKTLFRALRADTLIVLDTVSVAVPAVAAGWLVGKRTIVRTGGDFVW